MFTKRHIVNNLSLLMLTLVGAVFVYKYSARVFGNFPYITIIFIILYYLIVKLIANSQPERFLILNKKILIFFVIATALFAIIAIPYLPDPIRVARLSAIKEWLSNLMEGRFPYNTISKSSGFPILFFISFPFFLIGEPGYLELLGYLIFFVCLYYYSKSKKILFIRLALLLLIPTFYYEFLVKSELFFNMSLVIALILLTEKFLNTEKADFRFVIFAVLFGLLLSTRIIIGTIYIIYLMYFFRQNLNKLLLFSGIIIFTFILTVIPFVIWDSNSFFINGPFYIQFHHVPLWEVIPALILLLFAGWIVANLREVFFAFGLMLFIIVTFALIHYIRSFGFNYAIFGESCFDISYYIFSVPFLILSVNDFTLEKI
jgi:hypothetical protein